MTSSLSPVETISAVQYVLSIFGYPGPNMDEKIDARAFMALEIEPEDVQWMKVGVVLVLGTAKCFQQSTSLSRARIVRSN